MALEAILGDSIIDTLNFGPTGDSLSVLDLINLGSKTLPLNFELLDLNQDYEANYLSLDSTLARNKIGWKPNWTQLESIDKSFIWWNKVLNKKFMPSKAINEDIIDYVSSFKKS